jgi:hypothetical protein
VATAAGFSVVAAFGFGGGCFLAVALSGGGSFGCGSSPPLSRSSWLFTAGGGFRGGGTLAGGTATPSITPVTAAAGFAVDGALALAADTFGLAPNFGAMVKPLGPAVLVMKSAGCKLLHKKKLFDAVVHRHKAKTSERYGFGSRPE